MKRAGHVALIVGFISLAAGIYSRLTFVRPFDLEAHALLAFTQTCFLFAIAAFVSGKRS